MALFNNVEPMKIEVVDTFKPLVDAYKMIDQTLINNAEHLHLTEETKIALNKSLAELSRMIVDYSKRPYISSPYINTHNPLGL